jgi:hypothetical protein
VPAAVGLTEYVLKPLGKKVGDKATYSLPNGRASTVEILEAVPYVGA